MGFLKSLSRTALLPLTLAGCIGGGDLSDVEAIGAPGTHFPRVTGTNLLGEEVTFPDALDAERTLMAVGFEDRHKYPLNDWIVRLPEIRAYAADLAFFEVPVIYELKSWSRLFLNNAMRMGVTEQEARSHTVTVYLDRDAFKTALALPRLDDIYIFVLNEQGKVLWRHQGIVSDQAIKQLIAFLTKT